ncbi:hypothetical protein Hanom_Chr06g00573841 [Helianthus anomalus]
MPSYYPGRHMPLPRLEPGTSGKRWVSVASWATPVGLIQTFGRKSQKLTKPQEGLKWHFTQLYIYHYQAMKKILLFWQFSSVVKSKSKTA